jgi:hypothetical protein
LSRAAVVSALVNLLQVENESLKNPPITTFRHFSKSYRKLFIELSPDEQQGSLFPAAVTAVPFLGVFSRLLRIQECPLVTGLSSAVVFSLFSLDNFDRILWPKYSFASSNTSPSRNNIYRFAKISINLTVHVIIFHGSRHQFLLFIVVVLIEENPIRIENQKVAKAFVQVQPHQQV